MGSKMNCLMYQNLMRCIDIAGPNDENNGNYTYELCKVNFEGGRECLL